MSDVVFTLPGRLGDALLQYPVAYQWHKKTGKTFDVWMDEHTCKPLLPLFESQPCVDEVKLIKGVENWSCGGQPWHFDLPTSEHKDKTIHHLGFRNFPQRQITLETVENVKLGVKLDRQALETESCFAFDPQPTVRSLLLVHGNPICPHTKTTPDFWKFLHGIHKELESLFESILWVGDARDREIGMRTYRWNEFDDRGSFLDTARVMASASCFIGCGSSMAAMAQVMKVPAIRVHDPIGECPKVIWSGLGNNQLNDTEIGLRDLWPEWRDKWIAPRVVAG